MKTHLKILIKKEEKQYIAYCLELGLVSCGKTHEEAEQNIKDIIRIHIEYAIENNNLKYLFSPLIKNIWQEYGESEMKEIEVISDIMVNYNTKERMYIRTEMDGKTSISNLGQWNNEKETIS